MKKNFDYSQFFVWLGIGFSIAGFGITVAVVLVLLTGKRFF